MSLYTKLNQTITHWQKTGTDGYGKPEFDTPTTIKGREDFLQAIKDGQGVRELVSDSVIYTIDSVSVGDYLYVGASTENDPLDVSGSFEANQVDKVQNVRATKTLYVVRFGQKRTGI